ncbi:MAG TPA: GNAT family N-acetyltransferase [Ktedonobacterales bacterium]|jgi:GNAT superfamily N-acetyltransferase
MPTVRELTPEETALTWSALRELRPHVTSPEELTRRVNDAQRNDGYRLAGSFAEDDEEPAAVAGFRTLRTLAWGHLLYVDDLVTREARRGEGHADALMRWLLEEAARLGCEQLHLDSGVQRERETAHRFYFNHRLRISAYHFSRELAACE